MAKKKSTRTKKRIRAPLTKPAGPNGATTPPNPQQADDGKFLPGNQLGGNPTAGAQMRFRARLQRAAEEIEKGNQVAWFDRIALELMKKAAKGEEWAVKEALARLCGKHPPIDEDLPPPPPPPSNQPGAVTINAQQVNHNYQANLPVETQDRMTRLIQIAEQALPGKIIDVKE